MGFSHSFKKAVAAYNSVSLIVRIVIGIIAGTIFAFAAPGATWIGAFGEIFVGALKAVAPFLVFVLVTSALCQGNSTLDKRFSTVIFFYLATTIIASVTSVLASMIFPQTLALNVSAANGSAPSGIAEVLHSLLRDMIANPLTLLINGKYIGILFWAIVFGFALKHTASESTKNMLGNVSDATSQVVRWIINCAPFGIMGLVFDSVSSYGVEIFTTYGKLVLLLVGCMLFIALVVNPLIAGMALRRNPYPLVWRCLRESGVTAFFTRSSAANIPVNMALCEKLELDKEMYSVSIPLGATINMNGAAVTIAVMTLAAVHTLNLPVDLPTALVLSVLSSIAACGASGVAGGSLLLIPMSCSLFGISNDVAMQVVGVGFIIGVIQDSVETALNSSADALFTATAEYCQWRKNGRALPSSVFGS
ncbi:MAG: serine/threonine transporter SstT [Mailhella sp.]|nr:serine/threonine transporter SstT [Mailhella sp.]